MSKMVQVKVSGLTGAALDWAVAVAVWQDVGIYGNAVFRVDPESDIGEPEQYNPSTSWAQGGPLLADLMASRQWGITPFTDGLIMISNTNSECLPYNGDYSQESINVFGDDLLTAACRAVVSSKLGDVVEVPAELVEGV